MPSSDRNGYLALVISAVAVLVLIIGASTGLILSEYAKVHQVYATYQENAQAERDTASEEISKTCFNADFAIFSKCVSEKIARYYQEQATNQDLQAQQNMAFWAAALFGLGIVQIILSAGGIYLLIKNLRLAREANANTLKAIEQEQTNAQRQLRAYLHAVSPKLRQVVLGQRIFCFTDIKNFGQTPAYNVRSVMFFNILPIGDELIIFEMDLSISVSNSPLGPSEPLNQEINSSHPITETEWRQLFEGTHAAFVYGKVEYTDAFGEPRFTTYKYMSIRNTDGTINKLTVCAIDNHAT